MENYLEHITRVTEATIAQNDKMIAKIKKLAVDKQAVQVLQADIDLKRSHFCDENAKLRNEINELEKTCTEKHEMLQTLSISLDSELSELDLNRKEYEKKYMLSESTKREGEISNEDKRLLSEAKLKLDLYKTIINVKFDYTIPEEEAIRGYVRNKTSGYFRAFNFKRGSFSLEQIREYLWLQIEASVQENTINKENRPNNH